MRYAYLRHTHDANESPVFKYPHEIIVDALNRVKPTQRVISYNVQVTGSQRQTVVDVYFENLDTPLAQLVNCSTVSKHGSTVTIECDDPDLANDVFDYIVEAGCNATEPEPA